MSVVSAARSAISKGQLRRLQVLWHAWTRRLKLVASADRKLRHYYVERFTAGRAQETKELNRADAALVIARLERLVRGARPVLNQAAGTAGKHGFPERPSVRPTAGAWRALWGCARALGMDRTQLEHFIQHHYAGASLRGVADIRTMADLNRVLWGLKAMLRRGPHPRRAAPSSAPRAA